MNVDGVAQRAVQGALIALRQRHFLHHVPQRLARLVATRLRGRRVRHRQSGGRQHHERNAREPLARPAVHAREATARQPVDAHGQQGRPGFRGDEGRAVVDLHQCASQGDAPLRENHHRTTAFQQAHHVLHRHRIARVDRQVIGHQIETEAEQRPPHRLGMHDEHRVAYRQKQAEQHAVEKRFVIGDHQQTLAGAGFGGQRLVHAFHPHTEAQACQRAQHPPQHLAHRLPHRTCIYHVYELRYVWATKKSAMLTHIRKDIAERFLEPAAVYPKPHLLANFLRA